MEYANWWPSFKNPDWKDRKPEAKARGRAAKKDKEDPSDPSNPRRGDRQERCRWVLTQITSWTLLQEHCPRSGTAT